ncbi:MAG: HAMP domain-containing sensor histidine kinase [Acidimicrobiia bacterium]|nr:HAMP domain-containing sensor histidine kinase [Acidimicrobiia bacterium]
MQELIPLIVGGTLAVGGAVALTVAVRTRLTWKRRVLEAERAAQEAHSMKNDFVTLVSHELRTPLTSIAGFSETLQATWQDLGEPEIGEFLAIISTQAQYLGELVEDILVIPRLDAGRLRLYPEQFDLSDLVHSVNDGLDPGASEAHVSVSLPGGLRVWGDPKRTQQVIRNLLENAAKYGGDQVLVEGFPYGDHFIVVVSDNGPGIPDEHVETIFEHFEQLSKGDSRSSSGLGLGLPIARKLARAMGGDVWYERRFPTGSRFCFSITQTEDAQERMLAEQEAQRQAQLERALAE